MGTWSVEPFGNDDAADWVYELEEAEDLSPIEEAIDAVLAVGTEYLEAPVASVALAAIEVLARLGGSPGEKSSYTETADNWVASIQLEPPVELLDKAQAAIARILAEKLRAQRALARERRVRSLAGFSRQSSSTRWGLTLSISGSRAAGLRPASERPSAPTDSAGRPSSPPRWFASRLMVPLLLERSHWRVGIGRGLFLFFVSGGPATLLAAGPMYAWFRSAHSVRLSLRSVRTKLRDGDRRIEFADDTRTFCRIVSVPIRCRLR
jgi:hypothetical protein